MNQKQYIGAKASSFEKYNEIGPITGISLLVDEEHEVFAGDESGYVLSASCAYGTQRLANEILTALRGKVYKGYMASNALMAPGAELGDGVTIQDFYSMLASRKITFGASHAAEISAPGENEVNHEYPYIGETATQIKSNSRKISDTNSRLTKTAEEIRADVSSEIEGLSSSFSVELDAITGRVTDAEGNISTVEQTANKINWLVKSGGNESTFEITDRLASLTAGKIDLTGYVTFNSLKGQGTTEINGSNITTGTIAAERVNLSAYSTTAATNSKISSEIKSLKDGLKLSVSNGASSSTLTLTSGGTSLSSAKITFTGLVNFVSKSDIYSSGKTTIDGGKITAGSITANKLSVSSLEAIVAKIGGFNIGSSSIYNGLSSLSGSADGVYLGTDGISLGGGKFKVTKAGALTATNASITGTVNASAGSFTGTVSTSALTATGGTIGGFSITNNGIYKGLPKLDGNTPGVFVGTGGIQFHAESTHLVITLANGIITFAHNASARGRIRATTTNELYGLFIDAFNGLLIDLGSNYASKGTFYAGNLSTVGLIVDGAGGGITLNCKSLMINGKEVSLTQLPYIMTW